MRRVGWVGWGLWAVLAAMLVGVPAARAISAYPIEQSRITSDTWLDQLSDGRVLAARGGIGWFRISGGDGTFATGAGTDESPFGDGGPVTAASFGATATAAMPDGGALLVDDLNNLVRRVAPNSTITSVLGGGILGAGCRADAVELVQPADAIALSDGGLLVTDPYLMTTYRLWPDGSVTSAANAGSGISLAADGSLLVARGDRVDRVGADGVERVAAGWDQSIHATRGGVNFQTGTDVAGLADGSFLVTDRYANRILRVDSEGYVRQYANIDGLNEPWSIAALREGGAVVSDADPHLMVIDDPTMAPATPAQANIGGAPTGGNTGTCRWVDTSFGRGGGETVRGVLVPAGADPYPTGLVALPDGRLAVLGAASDDSSAFGVTMLDRDGHREASFGDHGTADSHAGTLYWSATEALPASGGALLVGATAPSPADTSKRVAGLRLLDANGAPDSAYGSNGWAYVADPAGADTVLQKLAPGPGGSAYLSYAVLADGNGGVARLTPAGALDPAFGGGIEQRSVAPTTIAAAPGGGLAILERDAHGADQVVELRADGTPDPAFGTGGVAPAPSAAAYARMAVDASGVITLAGTGRSNGYVTVSRLLLDGSIDSSWGTGGSVSFPSRSVPARDTASGQWIFMQRPTAVMVDGAGATYVTTDGPAVVRLTPDGAVDPGFGDAGVEWAPVRAGGPAVLTPSGVVALVPWHYTQVAALVRLPTPGSAPAPPGPDPGPGTGDTSGSSTGDAPPPPTETNGMGPPPATSSPPAQSTTVAGASTAPVT